jgi:putative phosphoribosyl transferase
MEKNFRKPVEIALDKVTLEGMLAVPLKAKGLVIFAHGSGSSRLSPRNNFVARVIRKVGLGTLLFDLLTEKEDQVYANRFDIPLLAKRLMATTNWVLKQPKTKKLSLGYFGSSTGSAAALIAASLLGKKIEAIVSRGGRPDLAKEILHEVKSPTLLIVGGNDPQVLELNQLSYNLLTSEKKLEIIPAATHLFEEPGTLEEVARLAAEWFKKYLC